ncbi:MAG: signal peptidase I [Cyanobacteria bacterium P01_H01_bin.21]
MNPKEPWLAVNLSSLLPGVGQLYAGKRLRGGLLLVIFLLLFTIGVYCLLAPSQSIQLGFTLLLPAGLLQFFNIFDAYFITKKENSSGFENERIRQKDPWKAFFLSSLLPGIGQIYAGKWLAALGFWVVLFAALVVTGLHELLGVLMTLGLSVYCAYHAYSLLANRRRQVAKVWLLPLCLAVLVYEGFSGLFALAIETRYIPAGSMEPTLQINDRLIINKFYSNPQRGDVVIFYPPETALPPEAPIRSVFIKRIVGLPGETLEIKDEQVIVNNQPLTEDYIQEPAAYVWGPEIIPEEQYFLLGDNRNASFDSHAFGFVPADNIVGRATKIFWPPEHTGKVP